MTLRTHLEEVLNKKPQRERVNAMIGHIRENPLYTPDAVRTEIDERAVEKNNHSMIQHAVAHIMKEHLLRQTDTELNTRQIRLIRALFDTHTTHMVEGLHVQDMQEESLKPLQRTENQFNQAAMELAAEPQLTHIIEAARKVSEDWKDSVKNASEFDGVARAIKDGISKFDSLMGFSRQLRENGLHAKS